MLVIKSYELVAMVCCFVYEAVMYGVHVCLFSFITGAPHTSQHPWPATSAPGGGAVLPCRFHIEVPNAETAISVAKVLEDACHPVLHVVVNEQMDKPSTPMKNRGPTHTQYSPD